MKINIFVTFTLILFEIIWPNFAEAEFAEEKIEVEGFWKKVAAKVLGVEVYFTSNGKADVTEEEGFWQKTTKTLKDAVSFTSTAKVKNKADTFEDEGFWKKASKTFGKVVFGTPKVVEVKLEDEAEDAVAEGLWMKTTNALRDARSFISAAKVEGEVKVGKEKIEEFAKKKSEVIEEEGFWKKSSNILRDSLSFISLSAAKSEIAEERFFKKELKTAIASAYATTAAAATAGLAAASCISTAQAKEYGVILKVAKPAAAMVTTAYVATAGLTAAGFTSSGIAAGSAVAGLQSLAATGGVAALGSVATAVTTGAGFTASGLAGGSVVAGLQSLAATGGLALFGPVGIGAGIAGGVLYALW